MTMKCENMVVVVLNCMLSYIAICDFCKWAVRETWTDIVAS